MERGTTGGDAVAGIVARLEAVSEELADVAMARLRDALDAGEAATAAAAAREERRLTRARRALERAIALLGDGGGEPGA